MECLLVWWHYPVAVWIRAMGDEGAGANSWLFKLWVISTSEFSPSSTASCLLGHFHCLLSPAPEGRQRRWREMKFKWISPATCWQLSLQVYKGEAAAALLWVSVLHAILVPPAARQYRVGCMEMICGMKEERREGGSSLQQYLLQRIGKGIICSMAARHTD